MGMFPQAATILIIFKIKHHFSKKSKLVEITTLAYQIYKFLSLLI